MKQEDLKRHLSQISTLWSVVLQAHQGPGEEAVQAQRLLLERYEGAIRRYLRRTVPASDAADELAQDFALRFLHGSFRGADPQRGRFRDYVKGVLFHLIADYHKRRSLQPRTLPDHYPEPAVEPSLPELDQEFLSSWRDELLARAWSALAEVERRSGKPYHTVLRFRAEHPQTPSPHMAEQLSTLLGRPLTAAGVRQTLHRAREKFADLLLDEVTQTLHDPTFEKLEQELIDLQLLDYCRPRRGRRGRPNPQN
jgi:RNA polymerase sigma-70 factor (ECF subfamily)